MKTENNKATAEAQIRDRLGSWAKAVRQRYRGSHVQLRPRQSLVRPRAIVAKRLSNKLGRVVPDVQGPMDYEVSELRISRAMMWPSAIASTTCTR
jgi:hypothetical protein